MDQSQNINITRQVDAEIYRARGILNVTNANMFISNNNNPFLVSPYAPPTNVAKVSQINEINLIISSLIGDLSTIINLSTFTLSICTITSLPGQNTLNLSSANIFVTGDNFEVESNSFFNLISTGNLFASVADISSLTVSSINVSDELIINSITVNSSIYASTTLTRNISTGNLFASIADISSLTVSSINVSDEIIINSITVNSSIYASTTLTRNISTGNLVASLANLSSINVSSINSNSIVSLNMSTNIFSTGNLYVNTLESNNITFQTLNGTSINTSTLSVSSLLSVSTISTTNINFTTISGITINSNNLTVNQNIAVSSINAASSIKTQELIFSSICMIPSTISSGVTTPLNSSILICLNGSYWKIPIEPA